MPFVSAESRRSYAVLFPAGDRRRFAFALAGSILLSIVEAGAILLLIPLIQLLSDPTTTNAAISAFRRILNDPPTERLVLYLAGLVLATFVVKDLFILAFRWWIQGFIYRQTVATATHMLSYFLKAPYLLHVQRSMADMMRTIGDSVTQFYSRTVSGTMSLVTEGLTIVTILVGLLVTIPGPAVAVIVYFALAAWGFARFVKPRAEAAGRRQLAAGFDAMEATIHSFGGIKEIKLRHAQGHFLTRYRRAALASGEASRVSSYLAEAPRYLLEIIFILGLGVMVLASQVMGGATGLVTSIGVIGAAAFRILPSLTRLLASLTLVRSGDPARRLLLRELAEERTHSSNTDRTGSARAMPFLSDLRFDNVSFAYPEASAPVLHDVSFTIKAGSTVAFVGGSGAGKTTVANLILGLLQPTGGRILADGQDIAERLFEWQHNLAFVPQDVFHMDLPISEDIAFDQFDADVDRDRLHRALDQAQLTELVAALPEGLQTRIGDRGIRLSGGQLQRLGIARALYREPKLLILDEATSALDNATERQISTTIESLHGAMTIVLIAHRLSTVRGADAIVFLDHGRVADAGTFAELAARNAQFAEWIALGRLDTDPEPDTAFAI